MGQAGDLWGFIPQFPTADNVGLVRGARPLIHHVTFKREELAGTFVMAREGLVDAHDGRVGEQTQFGERQQAPLGGGGLQQPDEALIE